MLRFKLIIILSLSILSLFVYRTNASAQALRAGIIGATNSIYKAELKTIVQGSRLRSRPAKQSYFPAKKPVPTMTRKTTRVSSRKPLTFDDLNFR